MNVQKFNDWLNFSRERKKPPSSIKTRPIYEDQKQSLSIGGQCYRQFTPVIYNCNNISSLEMMECGSIYHSVNYWRQSVKHYQQECMLLALYYCNLQL